MPGRERPTAAAYATRSHRRESSAFVVPPSNRYATLRLTTSALILTTTTVFNAITAVPAHIRAQFSDDDGAM